MSTPKKLRAGAESELTRFKLLWRDSLAEDAKSFWQELFISPDVTQAQIREKILARLKINLRFDKQLNQFRDWEMDQRQRDLQAERLLENERRMRDEHPDWSLDQVREEVLRQSYLETNATGDFKLGLAARKSDLSERALKFNQEKFLETKKTQQQKALEYCLDEANAFPEVQDLFKAAFAALKKSKTK